MHPPGPPSGQGRARDRLLCATLSFVLWNLIGRNTKLGEGRVGSGKQRSAVDWIVGEGMREGGVSASAWALLVVAWTSCLPAGARALLSEAATRARVVAEGRSPALRAAFADVLGPWPASEDPLSHAPVSAAPSEDPEAPSHAPPPSLVAVGAYREGDGGGGAVTVKATPAVVEGAGRGWVDVAWSGVPWPAEDDIVGVYLDGEDPHRTAPLKFHLAAAGNPEYLLQGSGTAKFYVVNVRAPLVFRLITRPFDTPVGVGASATVTFQDLDAPLHRHLALGDAPDRMMVSWTTRGGGRGTVRYKRTDTPLGEFREAMADVAGYGREDLCGGAATGYGWTSNGPGVLHTAVMEGLEPGAWYEYQVRGSEMDAAGSPVGGWSAPERFRAPPPSGYLPVRFDAFGDMGHADLDGSHQHWGETGARNTSTMLADDVADGAAEFVLHIGDLSYAVGYASQWDEFMDTIEGAASSRVPYMTAVGNHEALWWGDSSWRVARGDSGGECGVPYASRFPMPYPGWDPASPLSRGALRKTQLWYSFDYGGVHVAVLSTEEAFGHGSPQAEWLDADLGGVNRSVTPWVVVAGHRPMYVDSDDVAGVHGDAAVSRELRAGIEPLLVKHRVPLALWAHHHSYQRTCPVRGQVCAKEGSAPIHAVVGMAGMSLSRNLASDGKRPVWNAFAEADVYGLVKIEADVETLTLRFFSDVDASLVDELTLGRRGT